MTQAPVTERVTAVLAARVRKLRNSVGMSQEELGKRMTQMGAAWSRTTVAKLETGLRESVSVGELLALSRVFELPLVWLLADPKEGTPVPIAEGKDVNPWSALLWLTGWQPLEGASTGTWAEASNVLYHLGAFARALRQYRMFHVSVDDMSPMLGEHGEHVLVTEAAGVINLQGDAAEVRRRLEDAEVLILKSVADRLRVFRTLQLPAPPVPEDVRKRAAELSVELPGQEG